ncbi:polysaccharide deacetylase family protein [Oleispirillum naphthae]|uniref:polysaccharide deacetylase family protein n=1 Tax=Oleispirillum naphthae TaxID=2838853 RepID=UPI0030822021
MSLAPLLHRIVSRLRGGNARVSTGHLDAYARAARAAGIDRLHLFLSFDCDTRWDADAVEELHRMLSARGIGATYAVPGAELQRAADTYARLARAGAEFINHGALPHAEWQDDRWAGITFYDAMSEDAVIADIRKGDGIVRAVTGAAPLGFRAPHFGCFQKPAQVDLMHRTAAELGYGYCSTTIPSVGLARGPAYLAHGLVEFPCFGSVRCPETILDSWTYLTDRVRYALGEEYHTLFAETVETMLERNLPGVLTWYADPCHVLDQAPFLKAIDLVTARRIPAPTGRELLRMVSPALLRQG